MSDRPGAPIDYDRLMRANLASVFNERDAGKRIRAIGKLYVEGAVLYEPPDTAAEGHAAISEAVTRLLASLPPDFAFTATGPALGHHGLGRLRWQAGPPNGPVVVDGMDVAHVQDGRIHSLYVFIESTA
jgi:SnoaL-like protein